MQLLNFWQETEVAIKEIIVRQKVIVYLLFLMLEVTFFRHIALALLQISNFIMIFIVH